MDDALTAATFHGQRVLVTGCSSGIGRATALALSAAGMEVFASARDRGALSSLRAFDEDHRIELDVTDARAVDRAIASIGPLDVLVNNAGFACDGAVEELTDRELREQYEVNVFGPWRLCRAVLPAMRSRGRGTIVNISSYGAEMPYPGLGAYRSSKAALEAMSGTLHLEVSRFGIRVIVVQPGRVDTRFSTNSSIAHHSDLAYRSMKEAADAAYERMSPAPGLKSEAVARAISAELERGLGPLKVPVGDDAGRNLKAARSSQSAFERYLDEDVGLAWRFGTAGGTRKRRGAVGTGEVLAGSHQVTTSCQSGARNTDNQKERGMGKVRWHAMMSLDGFIAGPQDEMDWVFEVDSGAGRTVEEIVESTGALLVGRRSQDVEDRNQPGFYGGAFSGPFFVLRHDPPPEPPQVKGVTGQFLTVGIEEAVAIAKDAAGDRDVGIIGANVARQCLEAGLMDEVVIHVAPVLLGDGVRLFERSGGQPVRLQRVDSIAEGETTVLRYAP